MQRLESEWSASVRLGNPLIQYSGSGRDIAGIFMELPDRKDFGDYYKTITEPISLQEIEVSSRRSTAWAAGLICQSGEDVVTYISVLGSLFRGC